MSNFKLNMNIGEVLEKLAANGEIEKKMRAVVQEHCETTSKDMETYAKKNANWIDRTGNARQTIKGGFKWIDANKCAIYIAGNMDYSPYLELAHASGSDEKGVGMEVGTSFAQLELGNEGRYAILRPTIRKFNPDFIKGMHNLLGK